MLFLELEKCFLQFPVQKKACLEIKAVNLELLANAYYDSDVKDETFLTSQVQAR